MPKELSAEEKAAIEARKAAREKLKNDPKYAEMREVNRFILEDIIEDMAASQAPATDDESPFDYLARLIRGG